MDLQQLANYELVKRVFFMGDGEERSALESFYAELGAPDLYQAVQADFLQQRTPISLSDWVAAAPAPLRSLWLGCSEGQCRSIVTLREAQDVDLLRSYAEDIAYVYWVDQVGAISELLGEYRVAATQLLGRVFGGLTAVSKL